MNPERKEVEVFNAALELSTRAERAAYLDRACAGDEPLRRKVEALLQACGEAEDFFKTAVDPHPGLAQPGTLAIPLADYGRTLAWVDRFPAIAKESRKPFVEKRREVYLKLGRKAEADADERELKAAVTVQTQR
jgi:hypothetical protein